MVIYQPSISGSLTVTGSATITSLTGNRALTTDANDQLASSATTDTELGYLSGVTSAIQTQINARSENPLLIYSALGSSVKGQTMGLSISNISTATNMQGVTATQASRGTAIPMYLNVGTAINGAMWYHSTLGVYTATNENRIGLYYYLNGTATLVASSSNDSNMWSGSYIASSNVYASKSLSSHTTTNAGLYYLLFVQSFSSCSTAPTFGAGTGLLNNAVALRSLDFTNSAILNPVKTTLTALPGTFTVSSYNNVNNTNFWAAVY